MAELFKKAVSFTDIHFGRNGNSQLSLQDNIDFLEWFIAEAKEYGAETCIFAGDWHDNRHQIQALTLNYSLRGLEMLNAAFDKVWFIPGNHDLFYRSKRDVASVEFAKKFSNIEVVMNPTVIDDVAFLPWLVGDEHKSIKDLKNSRYTFAHLEIPGFLMNAKVAMPEGHGTETSQFEGNEYVFTGHFHMRQVKNNIVYMGNVMPFDFSDAWDEDRGMMFLTHGDKPVFKSWPKQPLFRTMKLSSMLNNPDGLLVPNLTARVTIDIDISYEEAQLIKDTFIESDNLRKIELINQPKKEDALTFSENMTFHSIDQIVIDGINSLQSNDLDKSTLINLYQNLQSN